jgi:hypothetical protein
MIVARMASRLDSKKIELELFCSHKRPKGPPDNPLGLCPADGTGPSACFLETFFTNQIWDQLCLEDVRELWTDTWDHKSNQKGYFLNRNQKNEEKEKNLL